MTLRNDLDVVSLQDKRNVKFGVNKIRNGVEIINNKEIGLLNQSGLLKDEGINNFYIDTDKRVSKIVSFYRKVLDGKKTDDSSLKKDYVFGWFNQGTE